MSFDGLLNIACDIEVKTSTPDAVTGEVIESWADHATGIACRLDEASGGEVRIADDIYVKATHMLFLNYRTDLDEKDYRIEIGADHYSILLVRQAGGTNHHTELFLEIVT